jgi:KDO2-lipid IV(A) lauroyltransferase
MTDPADKSAAPAPSRRRPARRMPWRRRAVWAVEGAIAWSLFHLVRLLPLDAASGLGGGVMRRIGPRLGASRRARTQIARAMPDKSPAEVDAILRGMWDNLGRVIAEYTQLDRLSRAAEADPPPGTPADPARPPRVEVVGVEHAIPALEAGRPIVVGIGHLANWEASAIAAHRMGADLVAIYRPPNNPHVDRLINKARASLGTRLIEKRMEGPGSVQALGTLRGGAALALLCDQHFTGGVEVPFFGRPAMTSPAPARFARHTGALLLPVRTERIGGARFRVTLDRPIEVPDTGDPAADTAAATAELTARVEAWVRDRPDQWLWLHRRWKAADRRGE